MISGSDWLNLSLLVTVFSLPNPPSLPLGLCHRRCRSGGKDSDVSRGSVGRGFYYSHALAV